MTLIALWNQGDLLIKGIALLLLVMSVASWYIIVTRTMRALAFRKMADETAAFWAARDLDEGIAALSREGQDNPFLYLATEGELTMRHHSARGENLKSQISLPDLLTESLRGAIDENTLRLQSGLSILASVGSTSPFIGLLGTVWGIYHALVSIGATGQASIDKVAGPVGEALIMTALGLAVAIPAVLAYNALVRANRRAIGRMNRFARQLHAYFLTGAPLEATDTKAPVNIAGRA
ncbi:MotA/TolQ/ExbB proton channel family protein [Oxalobacter vibrioformis]|uniref:Biopolymer transport protein ExbB n=1 Tax=Oxalobacter vibrioformis TaxID=933080 RepID=A0A9E9P2U3_9BURK|nr:MotA/TolQ/ExbB proton channel family protein [Oxalobacter vibrioformis]WAW10274.1 MotA/TolQ/ExbB proton channel family protein [Oxalobacter vibrioformis]